MIDYTTYHEYTEAANDDVVVHCGRNQYKKKCAHCGEDVPPGRGDLFLDEAYGKWLVVHRMDCREKEASPIYPFALLWIAALIILTLLVV